MNLLLEINIFLYLILFVVAGISGLLVKIDQWVEGDFEHPINDQGKIDIWKSFWLYISTFILSGLAGLIVSIGSGYFSENFDINILLFIAIMVGAVGKLIFYKLVELVQEKINDKIYSKKEINLKLDKDRRF